MVDFGTKILGTQNANLKKLSDFKNHISNSILTLGVPNRFVDHGPRNVLLEEIGLDSMTLYKKVYNFLRKSND